MSFHEVRFGDGMVWYDTEFGPDFSTDIARMGGGGESRNAGWDEALGGGNLGDIEIDEVELAYIQRFWRARKAQVYGFRVKDWGDFECLMADGYLVAQDVYPPTGAGNGMPTYDGWKRYGDAAGEDWRRLFKLVAGTSTVQRNGVAVTVGAGAGQISIDPTSGRVTFVADATAGVSSFVLGATTQVVLPSNVGGLAAGKRLYLTGFGNADAGILNGLAHDIVSVTGAGPYTFTLSVNTTGKVISLGTAQGRKYPQASDQLRFATEFDTPVRFAADRLRYRFLARDEATGKRIFSLGALPIEIERNPLA